MTFHGERVGLSLEEEGVGGSGSRRDRFKEVFITPEQSQPIFMCSTPQQMPGSRPAPLVKQD